MHSGEAHHATQANGYLAEVNAASLLDAVHQAPRTQVNASNIVHVGYAMQNTANACLLA